MNKGALKHSKEACLEVWELLRPHLDSVASSPPRLAKMAGLLDALMTQFPMPPPTLFAANDIDKCVHWHATTINPCAVPVLLVANLSCHEL